MDSEKNQVASIWLFPKRSKTDTHYKEEFLDLNSSGFSCHCIILIVT